MELGIYRMMIVVGLCYELLLMSVIEIKILLFIIIDFFFNFEKC